MTCIFRNSKRLLMAFVVIATIGLAPSLAMAALCRYLPVGHVDKSGQWVLDGWICENVECSGTCDLHVGGPGCDCF